MNPPIITKRTSRKCIREMDGGKDTAATAQCTEPKLKQHTITIPYRASTKIRLHEIAHCELGHCVKLLGISKMPITQYVEQEIDADEWAFSRCGKPLSIEVVINLAHHLIADLKRNPCYVFSACVKALAKHNYILTREQRSELWWTCREFEKEGKGY